MHTTTLGSEDETVTFRALDCSDYSTGSYDAMVPPPSEQRVSRRPACLLNSSQDADAEPGLASVGADDPIDVAFMDTRREVPVKLIVLAAALANTSSRVRFHAILSFPVPIQNFRVHRLHLPPAAQCLYDGLSRLAHGPGPAYLYKPLLPWVVPEDVRRLILLDTDVAVLRDLGALYAQFGAFGTAVVGIANEQTLLYQRDSSWRLTGKNGGVQLLDLQRMRRSSSYARALDRVASGEDGRQIGYLGDQTLYTWLAVDYPRLFHTLPCEWNRQLSMQFGFDNASVHACPRRCGIAHANYAPFKCIARTLQADPSCSNWAEFADALVGAGAPACPAGVRRAERAELHDAIVRFFGDCCAPDGALDAYRPRAVRIADSGSPRPRRARLPRWRRWGLMPPLDSLVESHQSGLA